MAETVTKQPTVLRLNRGSNGFYCPETRFHLIGVMKPQAVYTAASLSEDVKRALRGGTLIDVNGVFTEEDLKADFSIAQRTSSNDQKKELLIKADEYAKKKQEEDKANGVEKDDYTILNPLDVKRELMSEPDILSATRKELIAYIEDTDGLDLDTLGLKSKSTVDDIKEALVKHYGYDENPTDKLNEVSDDTANDEE